MTTFYIIRHGQTEFNRDNIVQGHCDSPLTEKGIAEAKEAAEQLSEIHFDAVYSSDLPRAQRTAQIILLERKLAIHTATALRERSYGMYDGKSSELYLTECNETLRTLEALADHKKMSFQIADIENYERAASRFIVFLREIAVVHDNKYILIVSHGGIMRSFLIYLGWAKFHQLPSGSIKNCGYITLQCDGIDFFIKDTYNIHTVSG
jgi:probable phosphoglycerate mutase